MSNIEQTAVDHFRRLCRSTKRLQANIPDGEKGKITDGFIDVFENVHNKQTDQTLKDGNFLHRLDVQVKGRLLPKNKDYLKSFPLYRNDLENIKKVGGVVLLVAGVSRKTEEAEIAYYADLSVQTVDLLLSRGRLRSKLSIQLQSFPTEPAEIYRYVRHLAKRQGTKNLITPDGALLNNAKGFSVTLPQQIDLTRPQVFGGLKDSAIIELIGPNEQKHVMNVLIKVTPEDYQLHKVEDLEVSCGDVTFSDIRKRRLESGKVELYFSPGICLTFDPKSNKQTFELQYESSLHHVLKDLLFMDALREGMPIKFNGESAFNFQKSRSKFLKEFLEPLDYFVALSNMCGDLSIDPKLCKVTDLSDTASKNLRDVYLCHVGLASFKHKQNIPLRHDLHLDKVKILLLWVPDEETGKWKPTSFFDTTKHMFAVTKQDPTTKQNHIEPVTPYDFIPHGELGDIINLQPDLLVPAYENLVGDSVASRANRTVLSLITSADETPHRRVELLKMASDLNKWTIEKEKENHSFLINRLQIKKRLGGLTDEDRKTTDAMWANACSQVYGDESLTIEVGTSILLGKHDGVDYLLSKMENTERECFKLLPIYYLHLNRVEDYISGSPDNQEDWSRIEQRLLNKEFEEISSIL
ncbi:hypothetical protein [Corynebacterium aquilae]|uniref:Uncharacterized protein n=1 Tax=Corynebacterium aquilae DSM 44791 TaxID=1431546 RepID=A0A1L7CFR1_9CORY|nr:hypothetical protein [Corynebacterium aquilae]APT84654.1 hypothetical protein CAQU_05745 [Corynebacterium aquilae DSM 44791]